MKLTDADMPNILKLIEEGKTQAQIAVIYNCTASGICRAVKRFKGEARPRKNYYKPHPRVVKPKPAVAEVVPFEAAQPAAPTVPRKTDKTDLLRERYWALMEKRQKKEAT